MSQQGLERKLSAILNADVKGYSRLMGDDEVATIQTLTAYREVMATLIQQYRGRVVDTPGDNLLAEFASVVDAVQCAVEVQQELEARNVELPPHRRMEFRIGINLGDVVVEGERIYGDGVNIAARLEGMAEGGGICISGTAYDQVEGKLSLGYEYLGEQAVKNIKKPVRAYRVEMEPGVAALRVRGERVVVPAGKAQALELPDKPSIAVLPFVNMSGDPEQEYFSDGITEDLITDLSKISGLFVIARNSAFLYKGEAANLQQVGRELGVRYVLEGSVRRAGDRVRITAQLVDARTGYHLWAERYDRDLKDIFALQDEVTQKIVAALKVKLTRGEMELLERKYTDNPEAYDCYLRGWDYCLCFTKEANAKAREIYERAIELDPEYALAYVGLAWTHLNEWSFGWTQDPSSLELAFELAKRAVALDDSLPGAYMILGNVYLWKKQHEKAIAEAQKAISLNPNDADSYALLGHILNFAERPEEAIEVTEKAMRLNPHYPVFYLFNLGHAYRLMGRCAEAMAAHKRALARNPDFMPSHLQLASIYSDLGREDEARAEVAEILRINPDFTLEGAMQRFPRKDQAVLERLVNSLRKVGLK